ncbi:hypothetical protein Zmor_002007 [Zophobas morio]|uniref:Uncharacterized protein n=1 Tax=Zophobas morio TaxID=2755281 RepID=A0AA38J0B5_9CUCU|nr:hypothetical protein Zmor_002007 [Zophobas morio]
MRKLVHLLVLGAAHFHKIPDLVTRAISDYTQAVSKKPEMKPFEQLILLNNSIGSAADMSWEPVSLGIGIYSRYLTQKSLNN